MPAMINVHVLDHLQREAFYTTAGSTRRISSVYLDGAKFDRDSLPARWKQAELR